MKYKSKRLYKLWYDMNNRCYNERCQAYKNYGRKGITVYDKWHNSYLTFEKWALKNGYKENLTIDRIDVSNGYCPKNCRWITKSEQCNTRSNHVYIEHNGEIKTIAQWAKLLNMCVPTFWSRVYSPLATEESIFRTKDNRDLPRKVEKRRA